MVADLPPSGRTAKVMKDNNTKIFRSPFIAHTKYRTVRDNSFVQTFIGRKRRIDSNKEYSYELCL